MSIETRNLKRLVEEKIFVDVYTDRYEESTYGFIADFNENFLVLDSYSDDSNADGTVVFFRENITRIRWGGNHISSTHKLIDSVKTMTDKAKIDLSSIQSILKSVHSSYGYVNISIEDIDSSICFIGELTEMDEQTIVINEYGTKRSLDRSNIMISIDDITKVEAGGQYEAGLIRLHDKSPTSLSVSLRP